MVQLSRIELLGFKSFADRTRLEFGSHITAIVGPNGSGKSNIADAVRWALGEQNARTLRGKTMQDLVFSGSGTRRAQGFAEVSLVFDNSSGGLPLDFSEVSISRRLYRSGDSSYLINGQECRWRDVTDLLIDSGIGQANLTVVDQARMDRILASDGEERRSLIESVAGVGKYRSRKRSTLRKLEETTDKIARITDIITELESRLGPLTEQARQATLYNDLVARRRQVETWLLQARCKAAQAERDREQDKLVRFSAQISQSEDDLEQLEQRLETIAGELTQKEQDVEKARGDLDRDSDTWRRYREQAAAGEAAVEALTSALERAGTTVKDLQAREQELQPPPADDGPSAEQRLNQLLDRIEALTQERRAADEELSEHRRAMGEVNRDQQWLRERLAETRARHSGLTDAVQKAVRDRDEARQRREQLESDRQQLTKQRDAAVAKLDHCREQLSRAEAEVSGLQEELTQVTQARDELRSELASTEARHRTWVEAVGADDEADNPGLSQLVAVPDQWLLAAEAAVAGLAEGMVARDIDECVQLLQTLQQRGVRRTVFVDVEMEIPDRQHSTGSHQRLSDVVRPLTTEGERLNRQVFSQFLLCSDVREGFAAFRSAGGRCPVVTRDGTLIGIGGGTTGGAAPATRRVRHLRVQECEKRANQLQQDLKRAEAEVEQLSSRLTEAGAQRSRSASALAVLERTVQEIQQKLAIGEAGRERALEVESSAVAAAAEAEGSAAEVQSQLDKLSDEQSGLSVTADQRRTGLSAARRNVENIDNQLTEVRQQIDELKVHSAERRVRQEAAVAEQSEIRRRLTAAQAELERVQAELSARCEAASGDRQRADECEQRVQTLKLKVQQEETAVAELRGEQRQGAGSVSEIRRRLSSLEGWLRRAETEIARLDARWEQLQERSQALGIDMDGELDREVDVDQLAAELAAIAEQIEALGPVNPLAVGECEAVAERHQFLSEQHDDLSAGAESLERAVRRLDAEMREIFIVTLRRVDDEYGEVFRELFGGGKARVELDDGEDDPLAATVDLSVQIPGKKMTSMSLLSGGERALCAIAFLFALLRIRPLPFCVLDEIDAALDEVNTSRFSTFLRRYCQHTQFISITHQKQTMEVAASLYGVTMATGGVSRILSVRLEDIERGAAT